MTALTLTPDSSSMPKKNGRRQRLPASFSPGKFSVLCGRGSKCTKSSGNQRLKSLVNHYLQPYSEAKNKIEKSSIVSAIIQTIKQACPKGGGFVKYEEGTWWEVEDAFAREKIGCLFRDCLHTKYRSSTKSKLARRKAIDNLSEGDMLNSGSTHSLVSHDSSNAAAHQSFMGQQHRPNLQDQHGGMYPCHPQPNHGYGLPMGGGRPGMMMGGCGPQGPPPVGKLDDYCSLLSNYLTQGPTPNAGPTSSSCSQRPEFYRSCMPRTMPYHPRMLMPDHNSSSIQSPHAPSMHGALWATPTRNNNNMGSLVERACHVVEEHSLDLVDDFPDVMDGGSLRDTFQDPFVL